MINEYTDNTYINNQNENFDNKITNGFNDNGNENEIKKYYYIYKHTNITNNKCYVGITSLNIENRWRKNGKAYMRKSKNGKYYHAKFAAAIQKYGWDNFKHEIIEEGFFTKNEIEEREIYWISYYDSFNNGYNTTEGGNISLWTQTEIGKKVVSESVKNLWKDEEYNRKNIIPVKCLENDYIFQNAEEVSNILHINASGIRACCRGVQKTAGGYRWESSNWNDYDIFYEQNPNYLEQFAIESKVKKEKLKPQKPNKNKLKTKPVLCLDKDIAYQGQVLASIITGIDRVGIGQCCLNKQDQCGGYKWKFIKEDEYIKYKQIGKADIPIPLIKSSQKIQILCIETNITYESIAEAYRQTGIRHISECCKGLLGTAGGCHWKIIEANKTN